MAAAWRNLIVRSDELGLAACGFKSLGERLVALTSGVGVRPLSQAAAAVSEAAKIAASEAQQVLESAQAAEAAAARALTLVAVAPNADRVADPVVARCREKATGVEGLPEVGVATAAPAEASARAVAQALERATKPSLTVDSMHAPARRQAAHSGDSDINTSGRSSSKRESVDHTAVGVIVKTDGSIPGDQKDLTTQPKCGGGTKATSVSQGRRETFEILAGRSIEENHDEGEEHEALNESDQIQEDVDMDGKRRGNDERQSKRKTPGGQYWHGIDSGQQSPESRLPKRRMMVTSALATRGGHSTGLASEGHGTLSLGRGTPFSRDTPSSDNRGPAKHQRRQLYFSRDCTKRLPSGAVGSNWKGFSTEHDFAGTVDVRNEERCGHADCKRPPSHGSDGSKKAEFCFLHTLRRRSNVSQTRCRHRGCVKHPSYGIVGTKRAEYCATHAPEGMANVVSKACGHPGCIKGASYGVVGTKKAERCAKHALEGMSNVVSKRCGHPVCSKVPSYGLIGSKQAKFCARHAARGMNNVVSKRCGHPVCSKVPSYGLIGSKQAKFCARHAAKGMNNVVSKRCSRPGCSKIPSYGYVNTRKAESCAEHALKGMVSVTRKVAATYGALRDHDTAKMTPLGSHLAEGTGLS